MPAIPLPPPLRANEAPSFTNYSVVVRLPEIGRRIFTENDLPQAQQTALQTLLAEIPYGVIRPLAMPGAPDAENWQDYIQSEAGKNWLDIPWFFAEEYFYQRVLEATGYFDPTAATYLQDPYALQKRLGLATTAGAIHRLAEALYRAPHGDDRADFLRRLLLIDLWGNQSDLSLWPVQAGEAAPVDLNEALDHLLVDERTAALEGLQAAPQPGVIDLALDNAGFELVCDLALAFALLRDGWAQKVRLHVKVQPVFVSDALIADVARTITALASDVDAPTCALGAGLSQYQSTGRLEVLSHAYWTSPLPWWQRPEDLRMAMPDSTLIIVKGDANYRRLLGDRHWLLDTPFAQVVDDAPLLALRTIKSEIAVGLNPDRLPVQDAHWMSNGRWGIIQRSGV